MTLGAMFRAAALVLCFFVLSAGAPCALASDLFPRQELHANDRGAYPQIQTELTAQSGLYRCWNASIYASYPGNATGSTGTLQRDA